MKFSIHNKFNVFSCQDLRFNLDFQSLRHFVSKDSRDHNESLCVHTYMCHKRKLVCSIKKKVIKIEKIYFYTFLCTLVGTRSKSSLKTKFLNRLNVHSWWSFCL